MQIYERIARHARGRVGVSTYRLRANLDEAPGVLDCSLMVQWAHTEEGIFAPRYAVEQQRLAVPLPREAIHPGCLIFMVGKSGQRRRDLREGEAGHVGIVTSRNTFVHAANSVLGVIEVPIENVDPERLLGFGRIPS